MIKEEIISRLKEAGLFFAVFVSLAIVTFTLALFARPFWENGLRAKVSHGIEQLYEKRYKVSDAVYLPLSFSSSALAFKLDPGDGSFAAGISEQYGIIVRMNTVYGAVSAVFYYDSSISGGTENAAFADFVNTSGRVAQRMRAAPLNAQISFWEREIPKFFEKEKINR